MAGSSSSRPVRRGYRAAAAAALALALGATGAPASGSPGRCTPGSPGVGDTYYPGYGNGGYNVRTYHLDIEYDPATDVLDGRATIRATATRSLCSLNLDLVGMTVRSVEVDGRGATWERSGQELVVTPARPLRRHHGFRVVVEYDGKPTEFTLPGTTIPSGFMATEDGATVAGQPEVATAWFPVNDHPSDKASYVFDVTVPRGVEVVANGHRVGVRSRGAWTRHVWVAAEPMASYLATIDIGQWDVRRWRTSDRLPVYDAVDSAITGGLREEIDSSLARQGEVLDLLERYFGRYPFSTVGAIVDNHDDLRFALETQTRPVYSKYFWLDPEGNPENGDWVVVHELAHQWFGDKVALDRWQDIWLNEGFSSYAEWLWAEYEGQATPAQIFREIYDAIPAEDPFWSVEIGDPGLELLFSDPVYVRGAMAVQALRDEVGDRTFWRIVRAWTGYREHGTTPEFIALAERLSGRQLDDLFDVWLFTGEKPALPDAPPGATATRIAGSSDGPGSAWLAKVRERLEDGRF